MLSKVRERRAKAHAARLPPLQAHRFVIHMPNRSPGSGIVNWQLRVKDVVWVFSRG